MLRVALLLLLGCSQALAQEDADLKFIPSAIGAPSTPDSTGRIWNFGFFAEQTLTIDANRYSLPVPPPVSLPNWQSLTALDLKLNAQPRSWLGFHWSERFNMIGEDDQVFVGAQTFRDNLREAYISTEPIDHVFIDVGRINLRNGVALGFNPTDFFRSRTAILQSTIDPAATRENRIGVAMLRAQGIAEHGSITLAVAPGLQSPAPLLATPPVFDPRFADTNSTPRTLLTFSWDLLDLSPQILYFADDQGSHFGLDLSRVVGKSFVFYVEWAGANQLPLSSRAVDFGIATGSLPPGTPPLPQTSTSSVFANDVSAGFSWASSQKLTFNLEYHYHQSGFSQNDFAGWYQQGASNAAELWFVRLYASDQQEPLMQNEIFARVDQADFLVDRHSVGLVAFVNPGDGSTLLQATSAYDLDDHWSLAGFVTAFLGAANTEYGSMPILDSAAVRVRRYF